MISLLLLPVLSFVAAHKEASKSKENGIAMENGLEDNISSTWGLMNARSFNSKSSMKRGSGHPSTRKVIALNGTKLILECVPAEYLVRTHMAPDFESPQLVRKLDWFHEGALIASFQQDIVTGISEEWWVAGTRYELRRPFYQLRVAPVLASDSGQYKCSLETDPLFTLEQSSATSELLVIVKPPTPSRPHVSGSNSDYTVTNGKEEGKSSGGIALVSWNHSVGAAHRPILRYSILISRVDDSTNIRVITTDNNRTSKVVDGLLPNVQYAFSVRAENMAGESEFGAETIFRTKSLVPKNSPKIISIRNETSDGSGACVEIEWRFDDKLAPDNIMGYRITVTELLGTPDKKRKMSQRAREWHLKSEKVQQKALICSLEFNAEFQVNVETDTGFGHTPPAITAFRTSESTPSGPPEAIFVRPISSEALALSWREPEKPNGRIASYQIYLKEKFRDATPTLFRLFVGPNELSKTFTYNITNMLPNSLYEIQLSASTLKGESNKSQPIVIQSDNTAPSPPKLLRINYECSELGTDQNSVLIEWSDVGRSVSAWPSMNKAYNDTKSETKSIYNNTNDKNFFYKVQFEEAKRKFSLNSTTNFIKIDNLEPGRQYSVTVVASFQSATDKSYFYDAPPSKPELFRIDKKNCHIHSSICAPENRNCKAIFLSDPSSEGNSSSFLLVIFGILSTTFLVVVFTYFLKRHCSFFTTFVKNKKGCDLKLEKCGRKFRRESLSLINDSLLLDVSEATFGQTVPAVEFDEYCSKLSANNNDGYRKQFQELEEDRSSSTNFSAIATSPVFSNSSADGASTRTAAVAAERLAANNGNKLTSKNRYVNVLAVEHSRIRINRTSVHDESNQKNDDKADDGYINANYVDSCDDKNVYIATQAPLPHTFTDFWAMIWQENCSVIVMITNLIEGGKRKCDQYWPSTAKTPMHFAFDGQNEENSAEFEVVLNVEHANAIFIHRIFTLRYLAGTNSNNSTTSNTGSISRKRSTKILPHRIVHQLQFLCWPDHGVPSTVFSLLHFLCYVVECHNIRSTENNSKTELTKPSPIVVHCSAGVGRSGSFILIDSMRRHLLRCDRINIQSHLRRMRRQRARLVQTLEQYVFCHDVLRQLIRHGITRQSVLNFPSYLHFLLNQYFPTTPSINLDKNGDRPVFCAQSQMQRQYEDVCKCPHVPECRRRSSDKTGECIILPGYYRNDEFIISSWPSECAEFWLAVWRCRCPLILLLGTDAEVSDFFRATTTATSTTGLAWEVHSTAPNSPHLSKIEFGKHEVDATTITLSNSYISPDAANSSVLNSVSPVSVLEQEQNFEQMQSSITADEELIFSSNMLSTNPKVLTPPIRCRNSTNSSSPSYLYSSLIATEVSNGDEKLIRLRMDDSYFDVKILRVRPSSLESDIWVEIERIQDQLLQCEPCPTTKRQQSMMILDPRSINSSIPFILCALQSAACQMEAEGFIDVLLYLASYRHIFCGCWSTQGNIEYIYAKLIELIHLKEVHHV